MVFCTFDRMAYTFSKKKFRSEIIIVVQHYLYFFYYYVIFNQHTYFRNLWNNLANNEDDFKQIFIFLNRKLYFLTWFLYLFLLTFHIIRKEIIFYFIKKYIYILNAL